MNNLVLPESSEDRKRAHERLIAQLLTRALCIFPTEEIDKETFLSMLREQYKRYERLSQNIISKWGKIDKPTKLLKSLKNKAWEFEGVKKFYNYYVRKRKLKEERMQNLYVTYLSIIPKKNK